jgi:hypothetical protein
MDEFKAILENSPPPLLIGSVKAPPLFAQLGLLVVDGSGSMTNPAVEGNIQKAQATNVAIRDLFTRFKVCRVARNFAFAMIAFDDHPSVRLKPMQVGPDFDDNGDYNPLVGHGGGTNIYAALEEAEKIANDFLSQAPAGGVPHSVVILVMSDGCCSDPARTKAVADRIKKGPYREIVRICCAFFGTLGSQDREGEGLLKSIASDPVLGYKTVYDAETLRLFFEASISAASGGIPIK